LGLTGARNFRGNSGLIQKSREAAFARRSIIKYLPIIFLRGSSAAGKTAQFKERTG
jgi:hypothetical protein